MYTPTLTYCKQATGLTFSEPYEYEILKYADLLIETRQIFKRGTIFGLVASAVSPIFNYNPTFSLVITSVSAIAWFTSDKLVQQYEPQAKSMIEKLTTDHTVLGEFTLKKIKKEWVEN